MNIHEIHKVVHQYVLKNGWREICTLKWSGQYRAPLYAFSGVNVLYLDIPRLTGFLTNFSEETCGKSGFEPGVFEDLVDEVKSYINAQEPQSFKIVMAKCCEFAMPGKFFEMLEEAKVEIVETENPSRIFVECHRGGMENTLDLLTRIKKIAATFHAA